MALAEELNRGKFFNYKGEIVQVTKKELVAYGTHSHSKLKITVTDLHGKGNKILTFMHNDKVDMVDVKKKTAQVISKTINGVQIMDPVSYLTYDAIIDTGLLNEINEGDEVIYIDYNNSATILEKKG